MVKYLIAASSALAFSIFVALFYKWGENADRKNRRLNAIAGKQKSYMDEELNVPFVKRFLLPALYGAVKSFSRLMPRRGNKGGKGKSKLEKKLLLAGLRIAPSEYSAIRFVFVFSVLALTLGLVAFTGLPSTAKVLVYIAGTLLAVGGPMFFLSRRIKDRQEAIRHQLPDILDLLSVSVEAGLSFDGALTYIKQFAYGPLVDELNLVSKEIQMGLPRREALKNLAERNSVTELKTFVGALVQSDQIGLPLRNVMRTQASQLRISRKQAAEEKAMKAPVKMMLPLVGFIFPVTFIILLGPAVLSLIETFGG